MVIHLTKELEAVMTDQAERRGVPVEAMALDALRDRFMQNSSDVEARDDWEKRLFDAALDCGVSVPDWALSSKGLYE